MIKRSKLIDAIRIKIDEITDISSADATLVATQLLDLVEQILEPKVRPLTDKEVDDHVLVKQVHHSRKDEVRNYVRNLEYEWKREYLPEDN